MVRARGDKATMDLLGWEPTSSAALAPEMRGPAELVIPRLVSAALKSHDRHEVARAMSLRLNRRISKAALDTWASPARTTNRIPLDATMALVAVTGDLGLLRWMAGLAGHVLVEVAHAEIVDAAVLVQQITDKERALAARKADAMALLTGGRP